MVEDDVRTFALADTSIAADIGERFYIKHVPDEPSYPFVLLRPIDDDQKYTFTGTGGHILLYQLDVYAENQSDCETLAELIMTRFAGHSGTIGSSTVGYCFATNKFGEWSPDERKYRRMLELKVGTNDR